MPNCEDAITPLEKYLADEFCKIWRVLRAADVELQAYKAALTQVISDDPTKSENLNERITYLRQSPDLQKKTEEKYADILRAIQNGLPERPPHTDPVREALANLESVAD
jgi:hypothetical protein